MLRIHQVKLNVNESRQEIPNKIIKKMGRKNLVLDQWSIVKESIDARDKSAVSLVYTVDFTVKGYGEEKEEQLIRICTKAGLQKAPETEKWDIDKWKLPRDKQPVSGKRAVKAAEEEGLKKNSMKSQWMRPVVVGFGPCGMFAALALAEMGLRPIVLERGKRVEERVSDVEAFWSSGKLLPESNVQFGEGGAGTFSDGKLTTGVRDPRIRKVLEELVLAGGDNSLLYKQKPHIGTDALRVIVKKIRAKIIGLGGEIRFQRRLTGLNVERGQLKGVSVTRTDGNNDASALDVLETSTEQDELIQTNMLVLALGHSARDTFRMLREAGIPMEQKPFSIGVRIEHPQAFIDKAQYGDKNIAEVLGAAEYKLSCRTSSGRGVYTFCMCPGGQVIASASSTEMVVVNGMSLSARDGENANSGLLVDVRTEDFPSDDPLAGVEFQERYERLAFQAGGFDYKAPAQRVGSFLGAELKGGEGLGGGEDAADATAKVGKTTAVCPSPTYRPGIVETDISKCLPDFAVDALKEGLPVLGKKLKGFDDPEAILTAVESRSSSPVRILRDKETLMSAVGGIFPAGEGAGYAGGIMSAAVDGLKAAEKVAEFYMKSALQNHV